MKYLKGRLVISLILKGEAIVLRCIDYSDTSQIITFFTKDYGKIDAISKGAKRDKKNFQGVLDLLTLVNIVFYKKHAPALAILSEFEIKDTFSHIRKSLSRLFTAFYLIEVTKEFNENEQSAPIFFDLLITSLQNLQDNRNIDNILLYFLSNTLGIFGMIPILENCMKCQKAILETPIDKVLFSPNDGGILCWNCGNIKLSQPNIKYKDILKLHKGSISILRQLMNANMDILPRIRLPLYQKQEIKSLFKVYITHVLEKDLKMNRYLFGEI